MSLGSKRDAGGSEGEDARAFAAPPSVSLPKGGGAIRGMGEKFAANPVTGTGALAIPIAVTPGRSGVQPDLTLSYDSGSGNGPFGVGFSLSLASIRRKTAKGIPQYRDWEGSDVFVLSDAEDLVPSLVYENGDWKPDEQDRIVGNTKYHIVRYRPRVEGLFACIERWTDEATSETFWRSMSSDNVTALYGRTDMSRIRDPDDASRIFEWRICASYDDKGNVIVYEYARENDDGVEAAASHEANRTTESRSTNRYLKRIKYANVTSRLAEPSAFEKLFEHGGDPDSPAPPSAAALKFHFEVELDYDEGYVAELPPDEEGRVLRRISAEPTTSWSARTDPFSDYRAGFEVRTYRLCHRVLMFHHFPDELGLDRYLVRATHLTYETTPVASFLVSARRSSYQQRAGDVFREQSLPALDLEYTKPDVSALAQDVDAESLENLPEGIDGHRYQWLDLDGEGAGGILSQRDFAWFYKRNLSPLPDEPPGQDRRLRFAPVERVAMLPATAGGGGAYQFMDLAGDGRLDCVHLNGPHAGFFERTSDEAWSEFVPFEQTPVLAWDDPNLTFADLTGDGLADVLITEEDAIVWYPSQGEGGFGAARKTPAAADGPRLLVADPTESVYLADLSGDGLADLVRIRNGEICYWPNLGYGRFGKKVTMDHAPWFDGPDSFDPDRIRLADIDGSGTTDLIYLGPSGVDLYFNESGNGWASRHRLSSFPEMRPLASVVVADLFGNDTACLVWSSPGPADRERPMRYVDLMGGQKPHLLRALRNNMGAETRITYASSTRFYLEDKRDGRAWVTRLPFPVHVVERVEVHDRVTQNRFVTRYAYHHGYFDGREREFRGFGMVEQWDTEEYAALADDGTLGESSNWNETSHVPPVRTKTWYHTGAPTIGAGPHPEIAGSFFGAPSKEGPAYELELQQFIDTLVPQSPHPRGVRLTTGDVLAHVPDANEVRALGRARKGLMLRQEVYAQDGTSESELPYTVLEHGYETVLLQPGSVDRDPVCFTFPAETRIADYERDPEDPRVSHELIFDVDAYGNELTSASVAYGRRVEDTSLSFADRQRQGKTWVTYSESTPTNAVDGADERRNPVIWEERSFELTVPPLGPGARFERLALAQLAAEAAPIDYHDTPSPTSKRLIQHVRRVYRGQSLTTLPFGEQDAAGLPHQTFQLAFTPALVERIYGDRVTDAMLDDAGYERFSGHAGWWVPSGRVSFSETSGDSTAERLAAEAHFFQPRRFENPFGATFAVDYDYDLVVSRTVDPIGNVVTAEHDYRVMAPAVLTDPNGNRTASVFDVLGQTVGTAVSGRTGESIGDSLDGFEPDPPPADIEAFLSDPKAHAEALLKDASTRFVYDPHRYHTAATPVVACTLARETHVSDLEAGETGRYRYAFSYSDGFSRVIQQKVQAEPGTVDGSQAQTRWVGTGSVVLDNKGLPVKQYEPFFTASHLFEQRQNGVSSTVFYDPAGRAVAILHPNHSYEKRVFDPWKVSQWDANDTIHPFHRFHPQNGALPDNTFRPNDDPDVGAHFGRLPEEAYWPTWYRTRTDSGERAARWPTEDVNGDPIPHALYRRDAEERAAIAAAKHAATPLVTHFDSLGHRFLSVADNGVDDDGVEAFRETRSDFDIEGNLRRTMDATGRVVATFDYGMLGSQLTETTMDEGQRWTFLDVTGNGVFAWDAQGSRFRTTYDPLGRATHVHVESDGAPEILAERTVYGEAHAEAASLNLRGRILLRLDGAGAAISGGVHPMTGTLAAYDFKGNLVVAARRLAASYEGRVDWSSVDPVLSGDGIDEVTIESALDGLVESTPLVTASQHDALNRIVREWSPDGSESRPTFNDAGFFDSLAVSTDGDPATSFVDDVRYDEKGQRQRIVYGAGAATERVSTAYGYDPLTFRLQSLQTVRPGDGAVLQDLNYTYDAVGNVTEARDFSQQSIFHSNEVAEPTNIYTYDATYRLTSASGREHVGQNTKPETSWNDAFRSRLQHPNSDAMRPYTQSYQYDDAGNITAMVHQASNGGWTRTYAYDEPSALDGNVKNNRLSSTVVGSSASTYSHDAHGNMTSMPHLSLMAYDFDDQLVATSRQVVNSGTPETTFYSYDGSGQRTRKLTVRASAPGGTATRKSERVYVGSYERYREFAADGSTILVERETLHVGGRNHRVALVDRRTIGSDGSPARQVRYQLSDHLGSVSLELDENASVQSYEEYYPFGSTSYQAVASQTDVPKRYRFLGRERDEETGLNCHGVRYYASWLGRWTSADPAGLVDGLNLYRYARNQPTGMVDGNGAQSLSKDDPRVKAYEARLAKVRHKLRSRGGKGPLKSLRVKGSRKTTGKKKDGASGGGQAQSGGGTAKTPGGTAPAGTPPGGTSTDPGAKTSPGGTTPSEGSGSGGKATESSGAEGDGTGSRSDEPKGFILTEQIAILGGLLSFMGDEDPHPQGSRYGVMGGRNLAGFRNPVTQLLFGGLQISGAFFSITGEIFSRLGVKYGLKLASRVLQEIAHFKQIRALLGEISQTSMFGLPFLPDKAANAPLRKIPESKKLADEAAALAREKFLAGGGKINPYSPRNQLHDHHLFPQGDPRLTPHWDRLGIDIQDPAHRVWLDADVHLKDVHGGSGDKGGLWNETWVDFFDSYTSVGSYPTLDEVFQKLAAMRKSFGI